MGAHTISEVRRDFRLIICDQIPACVQEVFWYSEDLEGTDGVYIAKLDTPDWGWNGMIVELVYNYGTVLEPQFEIFSSETLILPNTMPFPLCNETGSGNAGCQPCCW